MREPDRMATQSLFIVGSARSGTSVFCDCLNLAEDIYLLHEANLFVNHDRPDFVAFFNSERRRVGNDCEKGTYLHASQSEERGGLACLARLAGRFRFVGEKIAFGPRVAGEPCLQTLFFDFHSRYFYDAFYLLTLRQPHEATWSMSKMWPDREVSSFIECWLQTVSLSIDVDQTFPKTLWSFLEDFGPETIAEVAARLRCTIAVPEDMVSGDYQRSRLQKGQLPARLAPYRPVLDTCAEIYDQLRERYGRAHKARGKSTGQREFVERLKTKIARLLDTVANPCGGNPCGDKSSPGVPKDRFLLESADAVHWGEHVGRYRFASRFVQGKRVLDAGCGTGYGSSLLLEGGARWVTGIDTAADAVAYAQTQYRRDKLAFHAMDLAALGFRDRVFDAVVLLGVIEQVLQLDACLEEIRRVLRDDGLLIVSSANQAEHPGKVSESGNLREFTRHELERLLKRSFPEIEFYAAGPLLGSFLVPEQWDWSGSLSADLSCVRLQPRVEAPYLLAVCRPTGSASGWRPAPQFIPYSLDRQCYDRQVGRFRQSRDDAAADELIVLRFSDPEQFRRGLARLNEGTRQRLADRIRAFIDNREFELAQSLLRDLVEVQQDVGEWAYLLAFCHQYRPGDSASAVNLYGRALRAGFDEFWVHFHRGHLFKQSGRLEEARVDLERACLLEPNHEAAREALRGLRMDRGVPL